MRFDADRSGELDMQEMRTAFQLLQREMATVDKEAAKVRADAEVMRSKTSKYQDAITLTEEYEMSLIELETAEATGAAAKIGNVIRNRGLKLAEVVSKWGGEDGLISSDEFCENIKQLGVESPDQELRDLCARPIQPALSLPRPRGQR